MAKKKGNGEGTIYKRKDGLWAGQITVGKNPETGKPIRPTFYGKTRKEVSDQITEALSKVIKKSFINPNKTTLKEWTAL